jgi:hypothetical protein
MIPEGLIFTIVVPHQTVMLEGDKSITDVNDKHSRRDHQLGGTFP